MGARRELTEKQIEQIRQDIKNGVSAYKVARINKIGEARVCSIVGIEFENKSRSIEIKNNPTQRENEGRETLLRFRKLWKNFKVGQIVRIESKDRRDEIVITGRIIEIKDRYMVINVNGYRETISFADVVTSQYNIYLKFEDRWLKFKRKCQSSVKLHEEIKVD